MNTDLDYAIQQLKLILDGKARSRAAIDDCARRALDALERLAEAELTETLEMDLPTVEQVEK